MVRPIGIDLFSGAGGLSLGFEQAGFDVRAAVEIDPIHAVIHKYNFPDCAILPRSVVGLTADEIRRAASLSSTDKVDVVFGGPPCQGFSMIGHRSMEDPRNRLVHEFVRIVAELDAKYFVFENVKGLTVGRHKAFLEELVQAFDKAGYVVRTPWRVFDVAQFGVPQHRERLILIGAKKDLEAPTYPDAITTPADTKKATDLPKGPTVAEALGDLPDADRFITLAGTDKVDRASYGKPSRYAEEMRCFRNDSWHYGYPRDWPSASLTSSWQTDHSDISRLRFSETRPGETEPISRFYKLSPEGLSNTLRAGTDGARGAFTSPRPIHYEYNRCVTVREMARLHGFPDWFRFHSTKWHGARQIGNAVPPPFARAIASAVMRAAGATPTQPSRPLALGDERLLYMTLSEAASYLGIEPPNSRRNQRSGAKKRKQHETEAARLANASDLSDA